MRSESVGRRSVQVFAPGFRETMGKVIEESYLLPDRQALGGGLGGRVMNNESEKLNSLIQQHFEYKRSLVTHVR